MEREQGKLQEVKTEVTPAERVKDVVDRGALYKNVQFDIACNDGTSAWMRISKGKLDGAVFRSKPHSWGEIEMQNIYTIIVMEGETRLIETPQAIVDGHPEDSLSTPIQPREIPFTEDYVLYFQKKLRNATCKINRKAGRERMFRKIKRPARFVMKQSVRFHSWLTLTEEE